MWFGWPVKHFKYWIDETIWEQKNRLKSVHIQLFSEYLQITNVFLEFRAVSRMIHELQNGQISNKHYLQWIIQSVIDWFSRIIDKKIQQNLWFSSPETLSNIFFLCFTMKADWRTYSLQTVVFPFLKLQVFFSHDHW